jgi:hypothetical protein
LQPSPADILEIDHHKKGPHDQQNPTGGESGPVLPQPHAIGDGGDTSEQQNGGQQLGRLPDRTERPRRAGPDSETVESRGGCGKGADVTVAVLP